MVVVNRESFLFPSNYLQIYIDIREVPTPCVPAPAKDFVLCPRNWHKYTCERTSRGFLSGKVRGCMVDGRKVNLNDNVRKDDNVWTCQTSSDGNAELVSIGCLVNGREIKIGQQFDDGKFFYSCRPQNDKCVTKVLGCVYNGKKLSAFQNYYKDNELYKCLFSVDLKSAHHSLEGCVKRDGYTGQYLERKFGCLWEDGRAPFMYLMECRNNSGRAQIRKIRCKYQGPEGTVEVMPGCWTNVGIFGNLGVGCKKQASGDTQIVTFDGNREELGHGHGLTHWRDNPYFCTVFLDRVRRLR